MVTPNGTISMNQINAELGYSPTRNTGLDDAQVRILASKPSGTISMNDCRNKSRWINATGGSVTTASGFRYHTFTGPGTFTISNISVNSPDNAITVYGVGGGAGGGFGGASNDPVANAGGGGGAGELSDFVLPVPTTVTGSYPVTIAGGGGGSGSNGSKGGAGGITYFPLGSTVTGGDFEGGGGGGSSDRITPSSQGMPGRGSGGGGAAMPNATLTGGNGQFGQPGSSGTASPSNKTAGGGGGRMGGGPETTHISNGGVGNNTNITGSPVYRAGGGGGAGNVNTFGFGGNGGGGTGGNNNPGPAVGGNGGANTGGGGGGGTSLRPGPNATGAGGNGGSGILIVRYPYA